MGKYNISSWDLVEINPYNIDKIFKDIKEKANLIERKKKILDENISIKDFIGLIKEFEELTIVNSKLGVYAHLRFAEDSSNQEISALVSKVETFLTKINNKLLFFSLWFKDLPEKKVNELIKSSGNYHYFLESLRKKKPYTLKENEEKIINIKDINGSSALNSVYDILTSQFEFDFEGKKINQNELLIHVRDPSPKTRELAYNTLFNRYKQYKDVIGEIYKNLVNDWREECIHLRGYKNPINVRNIANDIPDKAVEVMLKVCEKNQSLFHRFFEVKRKKLGLKKLRRYDLYAPLRKEKEEKVSYDDAVKLVLNAFEGFSKEFHQEALNIINSNHVHSKLQKNKNNGAFCCSVTAKMNPYVLLNYTGTLRDVSTLAHELGHGIHHNLAREQTEFTFSSTLPLAETASIFSEMLLSELLLEKYPQKAKELIFAKLDDLYASIIRQAGFVRFEKKAHQMMEEGKTIQEMSEVYLTDLKKQLGGKVEVDEIFAYEWCYISHIFHTPFYCYAYAFGNLLTLALYEMYKEKGKEFIPKIIELLSKGGSESPLDLTKAIGIDITSEEFWQKGFDLIKKMIENVE
ncbi:MAG: M3 family oligoendopeptidase [Nanoarchaeota archaeon]|nr:M3 family oligoendopeptidase [Nanoarchaeota archaeon]MBU1631666.1 M3 family oligoendopeptidase [Nanoarchaeota archaeon]MBU1875636.1 M3 family oligoendopeptidase [Nanoarchaeota archaeon]